MAVVTSLALTLGVPLEAKAAPPHKIKISDATLVEGNGGSQNLSFVVTYGKPSAAGISVNYATADVTATAGADYTAVSGTLALPNGGCRCATIDVPVAADLFDEPNETFVVNLSNAVGASFADNQGVGTITDDDATPSISIDDPTVAEPAGTATFTLSLGVASGRTVTVDYATSNGSALGGQDYTGTSGTATFAPGTVTQTVVVAIIDDAMDEEDETFNLDLSNAVNASLPDARGIATLADGDAAPNVSVDDLAVSEAGGTATFTISLDAVSGKTVTVNYVTTGGTATDGEDYAGVSGTATFAPGADTATVDVAITDDAADEAGEHFTLDLSNAVNAILSDAQGRATIADDDGAPTFTVDDPVANEGAGVVTFTLSLDAAASNDVSVDYVTVAGTATDGPDYVGITGTHGTATIPAGGTTATVEITVNDDAVDEANETFTIELSNAVNATVADAQGTATITDDDAAPALSLDDPTVGEGDGVATFTVSLDAASEQDVTVAYATANGTATTGGGDYTGATGTATIPAGDMSTTVPVSVNDDATDEADETFTLNLFNQTNATVADPQGVATIADDDTGPAATTLTATVVKTVKRVKVRGLLEPAAAGLNIRVTLLKRTKSGTFKRVAGTTVSTKLLRDRDADGLADAKYLASLPKPGKGRYKARVRFAGTADFAASRKTVRFRI